MIYRGPLLRRIERYLKEERISASRFGRESVRDPRIVFDLKAGRMVGLRLERRLNAWLDAREAEREAKSCRR